MKVAESAFLMNGLFAGYSWVKVQPLHAIYSGHSRLVVGISAQPALPGGVMGNRPDDNCSMEWKRLVRNGARSIGSRQNSQVSGEWVQGRYLFDRSSDGKCRSCPIISWGKVINNMNRNAKNPFKLVR